VGTKKISEKWKELKPVFKVVIIAVIAIIAIAAIASSCGEKTEKTTEPKETKKVEEKVTPEPETTYTPPAPAPTDLNQEALDIMGDSSLSMSTIATDISTTCNDCATDMGYIYDESDVNALCDIYEPKYRSLLTRTQTEISKVEGTNPTDPVINEAKQLCLQAYDCYRRAIESMLASFPSMRGGAYDTAVSQIETATSLMTEGTSYIEQATVKLEAAMP